MWLTEQGVEYFINGAERPTHAWENPGHAEAVINAYVKEGKYQLTNKSSQITRFFYYSSRGQPKTFDSGLLEVEPSELPSTLKPPFSKPKAAPSNPREIYRIYKQKTPG